MPRRIMLVPVGPSVGLTSVSLGLVRALERQGVKSHFFKPVSQPRQYDDGPDRSVAILGQHSQVVTNEPLDDHDVVHLMSHDQTDILLENIIERFEAQVSDNAVSVIEGLVSNYKYPYADRLNIEISRALDAEVVFVTAPDNESQESINAKLEMAADAFGGHKSKKVLGCIFNKVGAPLDDQGDTQYMLNVGEHFKTRTETAEAISSLPILSKKFSLLGLIEWNHELVAPRVMDMQQHLKAQLINSGDYQHRRIRSVHFCARQIDNIHNALVPGALVVLSGDRSDVLISACLAALSGTKLGALLLTGGYQPEPSILELCEQAFNTGLPVLSIKENTWQTALKLQQFNVEVPYDDEQRIERVMEHTAESLSQAWLTGLSKNAGRKARLSPAAFRYQLTRKAQQAAKRIVLPEGDEPRTIKAAAICAERGIATPVLLGDKEAILRVAEQQGVRLPEGVEIISPESIRENYIPAMVELRKHKGMTDVIANEQLKDKVALGTMMLQQGDVDGLVSGAVNTTANTIRPALQLVKTAPSSSLVSSIFFMLLPEQVLVYGDCAINPDPNAEQLADIAIQSADSAAMFGIEPRVAMISYSTGSSGTGSDVEKVKQATLIAQQKRPDLLIDGPLQYDAALIESVAKKKAPNSPVAGNATVFIFPDLNTGNTTYKAVQRSVDLVCIGPMLQGMNKPVNDLSRGALVDDIVFTVALTAIQALQQ